MCYVMHICEKKVFKSVSVFYDFPFAWLRNTTKIEERFPDVVFQQNLAQSSRLSIQTHKLKQILNFSLGGGGILQAKKYFTALQIY